MKTIQTKLKSIGGIVFEKTKFKKYLSKITFFDLFFLLFTHSLVQWFIIIVNSLFGNSLRYQL